MEFLSRPRYAGSLATVREAKLRLAKLGLQRMPTAMSICIARGDRGGLSSSIMPAASEPPVVGVLETTH
jgi:hypothetical protein